MKKLLTAILLLSLGACSEQVAENYSTFADADRAGAIERGWIPKFVPDSAHDIQDTHDLDTNSQQLEFRVDPPDVPAMVLGLRPIPIEHLADSLTRELRLEGAYEAFVVCSQPLNGALLVDRGTGHVFYTTYIAWAHKDCSQAE